MGFANEILDAIEIMVKQAVEDNTTKIYTGVCKTVATMTCTLTINGKDNAVKYYGGTPIVGNVYQVFIPFGNMSAAFIIVPGAGGDTPETGVTSVNGKTGAVVLTASDVGALPNTTTIPTKTSQLDNDSGFVDSSALDGYAKATDIPTKTSQLTNNSGFITENDVPVKSVDGLTGAVVTNAVKTISQSLTDTQKTQARTNIGAGTSSFDGDYESLSNKPTIPTKVSQLENDSNYATESQVNTKYTKPTTGIPKTDLASDVQGSLDKADSALQSAPVTSVNTKTGAVVLTQDDVGDGTTYVRTHNDFTDAAKQQINTNEDNIAMLDSDMSAAQTDITTLKGNVSTLTTALQSKQDKIVGGASTITDDNLAANHVLVSNDSGKVVVSTVTSTELGYLDGVTSNIQTQLNKKLESAPVTSVNGKTGAVSLGASDVGAVSTSDVTITLGTSPTKVPSEKAVSDALSVAGAGDMLKATYDPTGSVAQAGGIPDYVEANGGKIDTIKVNGTAQDIVDKVVDIVVPTKTSDLTNDSGFLTSAPVTSVNSKTGVVELTASDVGAINRTGDFVRGTFEFGDAFGGSTVITKSTPSGMHMYESTADGFISMIVPSDISENEVGFFGGGRMSDGAMTVGSEAVRLVNIDKPVENTDVANKAYVDENSGVPIVFLTSTDGRSFKGTVDDISTIAKEGNVIAVKVGYTATSDSITLNFNDTTAYEITRIGSNGKFLDGISGIFVKGAVILLQCAALSSDLKQGAWYIVGFNSKDVSVPDNLVGYTILSDVQSVDTVNADTLQGHAASYFATASQVATNTENINALNQQLPTVQFDLLQKVNRVGDTMEGALVAQSNTNYTTAQVRNIIISTADPSGGQNGDIWIKYVE